MAITRKSGHGHISMLSAMLGTIAIFHPRAQGDHVRG
jgi:hypothetical protein